MARDQGKGSNCQARLVCSEHPDTRLKATQTFSRNKMLIDLGLSFNFDIYQLHDLGQLTDLFWKIGGQLTNCLRPYGNRVSNFETNDYSAL